MSLPFPKPSRLSSGRGVESRGGGFRLEGELGLQAWGGGRGCRTGILKCNGPRCAQPSSTRSPSQLQHSASATGSALLGVNKPLVPESPGRTERERSPKTNLPTPAAAQQGAPAREPSR